MFEPVVQRRDGRLRPVEQLRTLVCCATQGRFQPRESRQLLAQRLLESSSSRGSLRGGGVVRRALGAAATTSNLSEPSMQTQVWRGLRRCLQQPRAGARAGGGGSRGAAGWRWRQDERARVTVVQLVVAEVRHDRQGRLLHLEAER